MVDIVYRNNRIYRSNSSIYIDFPDLAFLTAVRGPCDVEVRCWILMIINSKHYKKMKRTRYSKKE